MENFIICGYFNARHQKLICTYNTENEKKLLETFETGTVQLLNKSFNSYQSLERDCRNMLDRHFANQSVFNFLKNFVFHITLVVATAQSLRP